MERKRPVKVAIKEFRCSECGATVSEVDKYCRMCGVHFGDIEYKTEEKETIGTSLSPIVSK